MGRRRVGRHGDIELANERGHILVGDGAGHADVRGEPAGLDLALELATPATVSDDHESNVRVPRQEALEKRRQRVDAVPGLIAAEETDDPLALEHPAQTHPQLPMAVPK